MPDVDFQLAAAITLAAKAHAGQRDKQNIPYIFHPLRVMEAVRHAPECTGEMLIAAVLHDVVEDCDVTIEQVEEEFGGQVAALVATLSRRAGEKYFDFIRRIRDAGPKAIVIKICDITDNLGRPVPEELSGLATRYARALRILSHAEK